MHLLMGRILGWPGGGFFRVLARGSGALHVAQGLHDAAIPDAHQVEAAYRTGLVLAFLEAPQDDASITHDDDILEHEERVGRGGDPGPERHAGLASRQPCAVATRVGPLDDAILVHEP